MINCISHNDTDILSNELDVYNGINNEQFFYNTSDDTIKKDSIQTIQNWIPDNHISAIVQSKVVGNRINALFYPKLVTSIFSICNKFSLWSTLMVSYYNSPNQIATSAMVEEYFSTLKPSIIAIKVPRMRVDNF